MLRRERERNLALQRSLNERTPSQQRDGDTEEQLAQLRAMLQQERARNLELQRAVRPDASAVVRRQASSSLASLSLIVRTQNVGQPQALQAKAMEKEGQLKALQERVAALQSELGQAKRAATRTPEQVERSSPRGRVGEEPGEMELGRLLAGSECTVEQSKRALALLEKRFRQVHDQFKENGRHRQALSRSMAEHMQSTGGQRAALEDLKRRIQVAEAQAAQRGGSVEALRGARNLAALRQEEATLERDIQAQSQRQGQTLGSLRDEAMATQRERETLVASHASLIKQLDAALDVVEQQSSDVAELLSAENLIGQFQLQVCASMTVACVPGNIACWHAGGRRRFGAGCAGGYAGCAAY